MMRKLNYDPVFDSSVVSKSVKNHGICGFWRFHRKNKKSAGGAIIQCMLTGSLYQSEINLSVLLLLAKELMVKPFPYNKTVSL